MKRPRKVAYGAEFARQIAPMLRSALRSMSRSQHATRLHVVMRVAPPFHKLWAMTRYRLDPVFDRTPDGAIKGIIRYDIYLDDHFVGSRSTHALCQRHSD
jgi:hypothetical protein